MAIAPPKLDRPRPSVAPAHLSTAPLLRVAEGGFAALTMQALADDVGIATGSLAPPLSQQG